MRLPRWTYSLKWRIVASYSLILIVGGVSTSIIGIRVTGRALLRQARQQVDHGIATARTIYEDRLNELHQCVDLLAPGHRVRNALKETAGARVELARVREGQRLDFLSIADGTGRVVLRTSGVGTVGDNVAGVATLGEALRGKPVASTELIPLAALRAEDRALAERAALEPAAATDGAAPATTAARSGMVMLAAAPVRDDEGRIIGVVYAGQLLCETGREADAGMAHQVIDRIERTLLPVPRSEPDQAGAASIIQGDVRIATNLRTAAGRSAVGTRISPEVHEAVLVRGEIWAGEATEGDRRYVAAYEPITDLAGRRIGMLGVGLPLRPYTAVRDSVTVIFGAIALFCFVLIVVVTYFLTRSLMRPLEEMVAVSKEIADGDLSHRVHVKEERSELGLLSSSFNAMLDRIDEMNTQRYSLLEQYTQQWTETLERKVQERTEQLAKTQSALDRQQRLASLGQLAAGVAHEINNPLGGILTFATLVLEELPPDSRMRPDVEEIVAQADRCRRIVQELLEFSRQREASTVPRDINRVITRTLAMLEKQASFQNIQIVRKLDPDVPMTVVDESQMQQVFMNVMLNAVDAMKERGTLTIQTGHNAAANEVSVRITDTGEGIPKKIREAIFDPFFTTKDPGKGTGLGLAVVCRIVQTHGGRIDVDSELGTGTTFTIVLPCIAPTVAASEADDQPVSPT